MTPKQTALNLWIHTSLSATEIGAEVGLNKNQIIGHMHREHKKVGAHTRGQFAAMSKGEMMKQPAIPRTPVKRAPLVALPVPVQLELPFPPTEGVEPPLEELVVVQPEPLASGRITLFDLRFGMCRDVTLDPEQPGGYYCAAQVRPGTSYCVDCHARLFVPPRYRVKGFYSEDSRFALKSLASGRAI
ncbi:GcrA cell cycle regulator [uncultured Caudovirales phage]|uniref:GcrA cell cycle regulator n=1 Tax=uncultured Caudovirales phage TaxID=2100421 RepID=A0A6J5MCK0_9CAUD|nr:GcrA cell cycle regulator [uncultured Caudovirales phage]